MKQKHTKGPWVIGNRYTDQGVYTPDGELVANTHGSQRNFNRDEQIAIQDANARLIAAAPELLEALEKTLERLEELRIESGRDVDWGEEDAFRMGEWFEHDEIAAMKIAGAAIAKAKGEAQ